MFKSTAGKLLTAASNGNAKAVKAYLKKGVSHTCLGNALDLVCASETNVSEEQILAVINELMEFSVDLNYQTSGGRTALIAATNRGRLSVVEFLLNEGVDKTLRNTSGVIASDLAKGPMKKLFPEIEENKKQKVLQIEHKKEIEVKQSLWNSVNESQVAHVENQNSINQRLREVFNFHTKQILTVVQNTETNAESHSKEYFAEYADRDRLGQACDFANENGQNIDKETVLNLELKMKNGRMGQKMRITLPK